MRKLSLLFAAATTLALGACVRTATNEATGRVDVDVESPTKQGEDWSAGLRGSGAFATVVGQVKANVLEGRTSASISLDGAMAGRAHPWMIHEGSCNMPGAAVGSASDYPLITIGSDGRGNASANIPARLDEAKNYIVVVHASQSDMTTVVACGDLDD
jgi:hypothetical protein